MKICRYFIDDNNYNNSIITSSFCLVMCAVCITNWLAKIITLPKTMLLIQNLYTLLRLIWPVLQTKLGFDYLIAIKHFAWFEKLFQTKFTQSFSYRVSFYEDIGWTKLTFRYFFILLFFG